MPRDPQASGDPMVRTHVQSGHPTQYPALNITPNQVQNPPQYQGRYQMQQYPGRYPTQQYLGQHPIQQYLGQPPVHHYPGQCPVQQCPEQQPTQQYLGQQPMQQYLGQYPKAQGQSLAQPIFTVLPATGYQVIQEHPLQAMNQHSLPPLPKKPKLDGTSKTPRAPRNPFAGILDKNPRPRTPPA
ncbi:hypothetical protein TWF506_005613 [Arthrobotrys conoides]|uniref:Uncharacterized protein n=1 Tax=Arthrobotrys conoides TaxID=74498 RepID=A0AAN8S070_9PEZI